jgi:hypothetical protein
LVFDFDVYMKKKVEREIFFIHYCWPLYVFLR